MLKVPPTICLTWPACRSIQGRKRVIVRKDLSVKTVLNIPET